MSRRDEVSHEPARPQAWPDADDDIAVWVHDVASAIVDVLAEVVVGVYLHGSLAMGSFYRPKSDLDLLVVAADPLDGDVRRQLAASLLACHDRRPIIGGLELSVITAEAATSPVHPMPYELHFSEEYTETVRGGGSGPSGTDPDLPANFMAARERGQALAGPPPGEVLDAVDADGFLAAIADDLAWILHDGGIHESPFYAVLNCCRALHLAEIDDVVVLSKKEGGRWALDIVPERHRSLVRQSLDCYRSGADIEASDRRTHGHDWDHQQLEAFRSWMTSRLASTPWFNGDR